MGTYDTYFFRAFFWFSHRLVPAIDKARPDKKQEKPTQKENIRADTQ
jgi:hypothetical protein